MGIRSVVLCSYTAFYTKAYLLEGRTFTAIVSDFSFSLPDSDKFIRHLHMRTMGTFSRQT